MPVESDRKNRKGGDSNGGMMRWLKIIIADTRRKRRRGKVNDSALNRLLTPLMRRVRLILRALLLT